MTERWVMGIFIIFVVAIALWPWQPKPPELEISNFEVSPSQISPGEKVMFAIEVSNKGNEIAYKDTCKVGIRVTNPRDGSNYWILPDETSINQSLSTNGKWSCELRAESVQDIPIGDYKFKAYITFLETSEKFAFSKEKTIKVGSPTSPGLEFMLVIATILLATYFVRRKRIR